MGPIVDVHHHWVGEADYIDRLLREMDRLGIEKTGLIAMNELIPRVFLTRPEPDLVPNNEDLAPLLADHGDRLFGYGFHRLGQDDPARIDQFVERGFSGVKFHLPLGPYDDPRFFDAYARADKHNLPCLFHTGLFYPPEPMPGQGVNSAHYRPILLDAVANEFPGLRIVLAHLGVCWNEEAATMARILPNVYVDLSGRVDGWRQARSMEDFRKLFYWEGSWRKVLFGSDVHWSELEPTIADQDRIFEGIGWTESQRGAVFADNAKAIFSL